MYNSLGWMLEEGTEGVEADAARGMKLYEDAISKGGWGVPMYNLGCLLTTGADGVEKDKIRAKGLFERAIEKHGFVPAMNQL